VLRFKKFSGAGADLERSINAWLADFEPEVSQMVQTTDAAGVVTISFLFEESFRGQEIRLTEESNARSSVESSLRPGNLQDVPLELRVDGDM
jgi:hypothetical protein